MACRLARPEGFEPPTPSYSAGSIAGAFLVAELALVAGVLWLGYQFTFVWV